MIPLKNWLFDHFRTKDEHCYFIETGTSIGGGVKLALETGYDRVFSMEKDVSVFRTALQTFDQDDRVVLINSDSVAELPVVLRMVSEPCVFWLDAHDVERGECSILGELDAIMRGPITTGTIMIDDWEDFGTPKHGNISKQQVIDAVRAVNSNYQIACYFGEAGAPNVLVATI